MCYWTLTFHVSRACVVQYLGMCTTGIEERNKHGSLMNTRCCLLNNSTWCQQRDLFHLTWRGEKEENLYKRSTTHSTCKTLRTCQIMNPNSKEILSAHWRRWRTTCDSTQPQVVLPNNFDRSSNPTGEIFIQAGRVAKVDSKVWEISQGYWAW